MCGVEGTFTRRLALQASTLSIWCQPTLRIERLSPVFCATFVPGSARAPRADLVMFQVLSVSMTTVPNRRQIAVVVSCAQCVRMRAWRALRPAARLTARRQRALPRWRRATTRWARRCRFSICRDPGRQHEAGGVGQHQRYRDAAIDTDNAVDDRQVAFDLAADADVPAQSGTADHRFGDDTLDRPGHPKHKADPGQKDSGPFGIERLDTDTATGTTEPIIDVLAGAALDNRRVP